MATDWDAVRRHAAADTLDVPPDWPAGVRPMTMEAFGLLGIDDRQQLYWDGTRIEVQRWLKFSGRQTALVVIVAVGTVVGGVGTGINERFDFGCKVHLWSDGCRP